MDLLAQNDERLPYAVRRWGCRFMSLLAIPQLYIGEPLLAHQVVLLFERGVDTPGVIVNDMCRMGREEHLVMWWAAEMLGHPEAKARQVGELRERREVFWSEPYPWQWIIGHWITGGPDGHWTLWDRRGAEVYDPWDPELDPRGDVVEKREVDRQLLYYAWGLPEPREAA